MATAARHVAATTAPKRTRGPAAQRAAAIHRRAVRGPDPASTLTSSSVNHGSEVGSGRVSRRSCRGRCAIGHQYRALGAAPLVAQEQSCLLNVARAPRLDIATRHRDLVTIALREPRALDGDLLQRWPQQPRARHRRLWAGVRESWRCSRSPRSPRTRRRGHSTFQDMLAGRSVSLARRGPVKRCHTATQSHSCSRPRPSEELGRGTTSDIIEPVGVVPTQRCRRAVQFNVVPGASPGLLVYAPSAVVFS